MSIAKQPTGGERPPLGIVATLSRLAFIGGILAVLAGTFLYLGGWLSPRELTPARYVDGFEQVDGPHPGFRRNHAKGIGVSGFFESNGEGARISKAVVFQKGRVPVFGRFSFAGGQPDFADKADAVRGLGLQFTLPDGELWRTAMINFPVFVVRTPEAFYEQLLASKPDPATGKPDPAKMEAFLARHPETVQALNVVKAGPAASEFDNTTFHGLNAFWFTNAAGQSVAVRWLFTPEQPPVAAGAEATSDDKNYLFDALIAKIHHGPLRWHLILVVGQPGDPTNDATLAWPDGRERLDVGTLTIDRVESEETSPATGITFDPLVLPKGISPSDDPLLSPRSAVYAESFARRGGEKKPPSAITPAEAGKGE